MSRIIDENGRLFGKISIIDVIVIILAIILACAVFARTSQKKAANINETMDKVTYTFKIENIRTETAEAVLAGDKLYDEGNGVYLGTVKKTNIDKAHKLAQTEDGTYVNGEAEGRSDLLMTIEADCRVVDGRYYSDRTAEISVNMEKDVQTKYVKFTGHITEIL